MKNWEHIKGIIFDLGGVIVDIDWRLTYNCFKRYAKEENFDERKVYPVIWAYERGEISTAQFRGNFCKLAGLKMTEDEFAYCWNHMVIALPRERIELIERLRRKFPVYLLSNINELHLQRVEELEHWNPELFDQIFWSFKLGARKPEKAIYQSVLSGVGLKAQELVFFDDFEENVEGAKAIGINAFVVERPVEQMDIFDNLINVSTFER